MSRLSRDVALNLAGLAFPVLLALVAIPVILKSAGAERLGFLTIAWAAIGYLGFLDFGLSRAIARRVAAADASTLGAEVALMFRFGTVLFWGGAAIAALLFVLVPPAWLFGSDRLPLAELTPAWAVLLGTLPAILAANVWRGAMEGRQAFAAVNAYRVLLGLWTYGAPIVVLLWTQSVAGLVTAVALGRWLSAALHFRWCRRNLPQERNAMPDRARQLLATLKEGAWMTVSNVVGPIIVLLDRFVIASVVGLAAAAAYAIPQEIALRMLLLPAAVALSVFPRFAAASAGRADATAPTLPERAARLTLGLMAPASLATILLAEPLLRLWLGPEIARDSAFVLQLFAVSVLINAPANIAFILLQARGRARWTAWVHLAELPVTVIALLVIVPQFGNTGAAWIWLLRVAVDTALMFFLAERSEPGMVSRRLTIGLLFAPLAAFVMIGATKASVTFVGASVLAVLLVAVSLAIIFDRQEFASLRTALKLQER